MRTIIYSLWACVFLLGLVEASLKPYEPREIMVPVGPEKSLRRVVYSESRIPSDKVVIFLPGRGSFFEKNLLMLKAIAGHGTLHSEMIQVPCDVWSIDHAGHGKSHGRLGEYDQRCHIENFDDYVHEAEEVIHGTILKHYANQKKKFYLVGASMGGAVALRIVQEHFNRVSYDQNPHFKMPFHKVILIAPMVDFKTGVFPTWIAWGLCYAATALGWGETYAFGFHDLDLSKADFSKFSGHHNEEDFHRTNELLRNAPHMITSGPTFSWVYAAFEAVEKLKRFTQQYQAFQSPKPSIVGFIAGDDTFVHSDTARNLLQNVGATVYYYPTARHNLSKETPEHVPDFWKHFFAALGNEE